MLPRGRWAVYEGSWGTNHLVNANVNKTIFLTLTLLSIGYTFTPWSFINPLRQVLGSWQAYLREGNCFLCFVQVASQNQKDVFYGFSYCSFTFNLLSRRRTQQQQVDVNNLKKQQKNKRIACFTERFWSYTNATRSPLCWRAKEIRCWETLRKYYMEGN